DMAERWCVPVRESGVLHGYLWVLDPHRKVSENDVAEALPVAGLAARTMARLQPDADERDRRRAVLLSRLQAGSNPDAARALVDLEDLSTDAVVVVNQPRVTGGWALSDGMTAHVDPRPGGAHTSGPPVPLEQLGVAVWRALVTRRAVRAGARLARPTWDALGSWHLVVTASPDLSPGLIHPGADLLRSQRRDDLLLTARCVLDNAGDVTLSADELHIHRSTLYYRLDRIEALTGVNLRLAAGRDDLHLALHLAAYRDA
ncbi:MAG: helix-turn-helix domain-containing protein, partial [Nostocoides sp.]